MSAVVTHPRVVELIERRKLRKKVERAVSRLIAILDELDSDPEAEPWLGANAVLYAGHFDQRRWAEGVNDDREAGDVLDEPHDPEGEAEPSLAAPEWHQDQRRWAASGHDDRELVDEDGEGREIFRP